MQQTSVHRAVAVLVAISSDNVTESHFNNNSELSISPTQGGITCRAIDEPRKSSKAIDERVIIDFRDKNVVIGRFRDKNGGFLFYR